MAFTTRTRQGHGHRRVAQPIELREAQLHVSARLADEPPAVAAAHRQKHGVDPAVQERGDGRRGERDAAKDKHLVHLAHPDPLHDGALALDGEQLAVHRQRYPLLHQCQRRHRSLPSTVFVFVFGTVTVHGHGHGLSR